MRNRKNNNILFVFDDTLFILVLKVCDSAN